ARRRPAPGRGGGRQGAGIGRGPARGPERGRRHVSRGCGRVRPGCHPGHRRARWCWVVLVARDRGLPDRGGRRARSGSSSRKRGIGHLTSVPDPDLVPSSDEHADEPCAAAGSVEEETGADLGDEGGSGTGPGNESPGGEEAARAICLRLLTTGPRTRAQLATALRKRRIPDEVAESVLSRFK